MLTNSSIESVEPIVDELSRANQILRPAESSMIKELNDVSISHETESAIRQGVPVTPDYIRNDSQAENAGHVVEHDIVMEKNIERLAESLRGVLHIARSEIIPKAKEVYEDYTNRLQHMEVDVEEPAVIVENTYHDIWSSSQLNSMIERYENTPLNAYRFETTLPMLDGEQIRQMVFTDIESLDTFIEEYLEDLPAGKLVETYRAVFVDNAIEIGRATNAMHRLDDFSDFDRNTILLTYLIAQGLERQIPDGVNVPLEDLRTYLSRMIEQSGRAVAAEIKRRQRDFRNKVLVVRTHNEDWEFGDGTRHVVIVNHDVYRAYLEEGGSKESLLGAAMSSRSVEYRDLLENAQENERHYYKHLGIHNQRVSSQIYYAKREAARLSMTKAINDLPDEQLPAPRERMHDRLLELLGNYEAKHFSDELLLIRNLIARVIYANYPNALMVLRAMDQAEADNPKLSARECALFAVIDLLARWSARQIQVEYR